MNEQEQRLDGPDVLVTKAYGDDIPAIKMAALDIARELYGPDARLRIERMGRVTTAARTDLGKFFAQVEVRCLNLPEEDRS